MATLETGKTYGVQFVGVPEQITFIASNTASITDTRLIGVERKNLKCYNAGTEMISTPSVTFDDSTGTITFPGTLTGEIFVSAIKY